MKLRLKLLLLVLGLQATWIVGTTWVQENLFRHGTVVLLETRPVDARDLRRGDYLILNYQISDVPLGLFTPARTNAPGAGQAVYVALQPQGSFYEVVAASTQSLPPKAGQVLLKGRTAKRRHKDNSVHIEYGLERYYAPEKTGIPRGEMTVQAVVAASGHCQIRQVLVDGQPYAQALRAGRH